MDTLTPRLCEAELAILQAAHRARGGCAPAVLWQLLGCLRQQDTLWHSLDLTWLRCLVLRPALSLADPLAV